MAISREELEEGIENGTIKKGSKICCSCCGESKIEVDNDDPEDETVRYEICKECDGKGYTN